MYSAHSSQPPICGVCQEPVSLEICKTDKSGHAVHEECYLVKLGLMHAKIVVRHNPPRSVRPTKTAEAYAWGWTT